MAPDTDDEDENDDGRVEGDKGKMPIKFLTLLLK
jgi:hypothetical protein